ncbi:MAG: SDR family NAD(P)-dependent oxidoreductase [Armatimonadota bacterium]
MHPRTAIVTGAASGIGRAVAARFAAVGTRVYLLDRDELAGAAAAAAVNAETASPAGPLATFLPCDVTDENAVREAFAAVAAEAGELDVLVTAAGILEGAFRPVEELSLETWERVLRVNATGTFLCCRAAAPLLAPGGTILCLSSRGGVTGPSSSLAYGASKAAVYGFCQTLEKQLGPRAIRVHAVCPGAIDTPMKRRNLQDAAEAGVATAAETLLENPERLAELLVLLASPEAALLTGTLFTR